MDCLSWLRCDGWCGLTNPVAPSFRPPMMWQQRGSYCVRNRVANCHTACFRCVACLCVQEQLWSHQSGCFIVSMCRFGFHSAHTTQSTELHRTPLSLASRYRCVTYALLGTRHHPRIQSLRARTGMGTAPAPETKLTWRC